MGLEPAGLLLCRLRRMRSCLGEIRHTRDVEDELEGDYLADRESDETYPQVARRVTSADVARELGISRATVSYVLNDAPGARVSPGTRKLVHETAARLGHVPSSAGRSLRLGRSEVVLALVRSFSGAGYVAQRTLEVLDETMIRNGYALVVHRYSPEDRDLSSLWKMITPAVVVAMGGLSIPEAKAIKDSHGHLVSAQGLYPHREAGRLQVGYLHERGHTRIGYAQPLLRRAAPPLTERLTGVEQACAALGLGAPLVETISTDDPATFLSALDRWRAAGVSAVCAYNDEIAAMLILAASEVGVTVPDALAVIGVDDIPLARFGITTVGIDVEAYAAAISESTLASLEQRPPPPAPEGLLSVVPRSSA